MLKMVEDVIVAVVAVVRVVMATWVNILALRLCL